MAAYQAILGATDPPSVVTTHLVIYPILLCIYIYIYIYIYMTYDINNITNFVPFIHIYIYILYYTKKSNLPVLKSLLNI